MLHSAMKTYVSYLLVLTTQLVCFGHSEKAISARSQDSGLFLSTPINSQLTLDEWFILSREADMTTDWRVATHEKQSHRGGQIIRMTNGQVIYSPPPDYVGEDSFIITVMTGSDSRQIRTVKVVIAVSHAVDSNASRDEILEGVSYIERAGVPSPIAVWGNAFGVARDADHQPWVGASTLGHGRIIAFGHVDYVNFARADANVDDSSRLYHNIISWIAGQSDKRLNIITNVSETRTWLREQGFSGVKYSKDWSRALSQADVAILALDRHMSDEQVALLRAYVVRGGALIAGQIGWVLKTYGGYEAGAAPPNILMQSAGLGWAAKKSSAKSAIAACTKYANATHAVEALTSKGSDMCLQSSQEAMTAATMVISLLPMHHPSYNSLLEPILAHSELLVPSPQNVITNELHKCLLRLESRHVHQTPLQFLTPHRTADPVFGAIPDSSERVSQTISYDAVLAGRNTRGDSSSIWLSTGLYAAPGEILSFTVPEHIVGKGIYVKIGAEWDNIDHRPGYRRMPSGNSRDFHIGSPSVAAGNAYGGLVYFVVPKDVAVEAFTVNIQNAIRAPYFVLGEHTNDEWINTIRSFPAPWAELAADNIIIAVRSEKIRELEDAEGLMRFWSEGLRVQTDLAGLTGRRTRPERLHTMVATRAGYGYAGYPNGGHEWNFTNYEAFLNGQGGWGPFHELGHHHQSRYWTDPRTREVTVNIFTMKSFAKVTLPGRLEGRSGWTRMWDQEERLKMYQSAKAKGGFAFGCNAEKLVMFSELIHAFGWEAFRTFFETYHDDEANNPTSLPQTDQEEWDQWLIRLSRCVGFDLSPFFVSWEFGVSQDAILSLSDLPSWNHPAYGDYK